MYHISNEIHCGKVLGRVLKVTEGNPLTFANTRMTHAEILALRETILTVTRLFWKKSYSGCRWSVGNEPWDHFCGSVFAAAKARGLGFHTTVAPKVSDLHAPRFQPCANLGGGGAPWCQLPCQMFNRDPLLLHSASLPI